MSGALLAAGAALLFGLNSAVIRRGVLKAPPYYAILATILGATPIFLLLAAGSGQLFRAMELGWVRLGAIAATGVLNFLGGRFFAFKAIEAMGANASAPLRMLSSLFGAALGVTLLGEHVSALRGTGIALLVAAPMIAFARPSVIRQELQEGTPFRLVEGVLFGLIAAGSYGAAAFLLRYFLADTGLSLLGAATAHSGAAVALLISLALPGRLLGVRNLEPEALRIFAVSLALMAIAQFLRFAALESAPVSVVAPLTEGAGVFGLGFAYLLNRRTESFGKPVLAGVLMAVAGAIAIVR